MGGLLHLKFENGRSRKNYGEKLIEVRGRINEDFKPHRDEIMLDELIFVFETARMRILPVTDTDELAVELSEVDLSGASLMKIRELDKFSGRRLADVWQCFNSRNYFDLFVIAFDRLHPGVINVSEGGVLKIFAASVVGKDEG